jgi:hypothetical protein
MAADVCTHCAERKNVCGGGGGGGGGRLSEVAPTASTSWRWSAVVKTVPYGQIDGWQPSTAGFVDRL